MKSAFISLFILSLSMLASAQVQGVHLVTDEAEAVLSILEKKSQGRPIVESDWNILFATDGYKRFKAREVGMKREFQDSAFQTFVLSQDLYEKRAELSLALESWKGLDMEACRARALSYLPANTAIDANVYVLIKPQTNTFVWDAKTDPAIMLYLNPDASKDYLTATIAHEMHHIGFSRSCPSQEYKQWIASQPEEVQTAFMWMGAFGEGFAVIAAAGGPAGDPQVGAQQDVLDDWKFGMSHQSERFEQVENFLEQMLKGELKGNEATSVARNLYGIVGPWYTVGYTMGVTIEKAFGRDRLIACFQDPRLLLKTYNEAARLHGKDNPSLPLWSDQLAPLIK